jgi:hypothetical protein
LTRDAQVELADVPVIDARATPPFYTSKSKQFYVDGKKIPDVSWDAGPSYAGLLPISSAKNETRKLFFWSVLTRLFLNFSRLISRQVLAYNESDVHGRLDLLDQWRSRLQ